jgi:hypothetical protein
MLRGRPLRAAAVAAVVSSSAGLLMGVPVVEVAIGGVLTALVCGGIYLLVNKFSDGLVLPIGILMGGGMALIALQFVG